MTRKSKGRGRRKGRNILLVASVLILSALAGTMLIASWAFKVNSTGAHHSERFIVQPNEQASTVIDRLLEGGWIEDDLSLRRYFALRQWENAMRAGRYEIEGGLDNRTLARRLLSGSREAVQVQFTGVRLPSTLAGIVAGQISADSAELASLLGPENVRILCIPNTYELWWKTSAEDFVERMEGEWNKWWTLARRAQAEAIGLSPAEVHVLASIVKAEVSKTDEADVVAGLYLNRLDKGMHLQADPTLVYATGDFSIRRVLDVHREIDSPYNTYLHTGLPPGPINYPESVYLKAVLNAKDHKYLYMCARDDFSGYHAFAKTYRAHLRNAKRYHRALNSEQIYR